MAEKTFFYLTKLKEDLSRRQRNNPTYSLRAYARDLGMPVSTLSQVLLGKRRLPMKNSARILERVAMDFREQALFLESVARRQITLDSISLSEIEHRFMLDETYFQIIAEWEHYAVLMLFGCDGFDASEGGIEDEIARRLGITRLRAEVVLANLLRYEMLKKEDGRFLRCQSHLRTTEGVLSPALRASHRESLDLAKRKLEEVPMSLRDFSSLTVPIDPEKLPKAKAIIREFREKMASLMKSGDHREVYQLAIQFFPLTQVQEEQG